MTPGPLWLSSQRSSLPPRLNTLPLMENYWQPILLFVTSVSSWKDKSSLFSQSTSLGCTLCSVPVHCGLPGSSQNLPYITEFTSDIVHVLVLKMLFLMPYPDPTVQIPPVLQPHPTQHLSPPLILISPPLVLISPPFLPFSPPALPSSPLRCVHSVSPVLCFLWCVLQLPQTPYSQGSLPEAVPISSRDLSPWCSCLTETSVLKIGVAWASQGCWLLNKVVSLVPAEQGSDLCLFSSSVDSCSWEEILTCSPGSGQFSSFQPELLLCPHHD